MEKVSKKYFEEGFGSDEKHPRKINKTLFYLVKLAGGNKIIPTPALTDNKLRCSLIYGYIIAAPFTFPKFSRSSSDSPFFSKVPTIFMLDSICFSSL